MGRFQNSLALAKSSWQVMREDKHLTLLPLFSLLSTLLVFGIFILPIGLIARSSTGDYSGSSPLVWILAFLGYLALAFVAIFFNAALVWAADRRLSGEPMTVGEALTAASTRIHVLLPWAIVSATVSVVLRAIESRGAIGRIVGSLIGLAWAVVTFLVLPVLVFEGLGPIAAVKRSGAMFKETWGENLIANAGIGLVTSLVALVGLVPVIALVALGGPALVLGVVVGAIWLLAVIVVSTTLTGIFQTALYRFANGKPVPGFEPAELTGAFRTRRS